MPRVKKPSAEAALKHPREFSILINLAKDGEIPREVSWPAQHLIAHLARRRSGTRASLALPLPLILLRPC